MKKMKAKHPELPHISGLYAITPDTADTAQMCSMVEAAIAGGARIVQYRNKTADSKLRITQSQALLKICRQHDVPLIINDHIKLCLALDADGVHLGKVDGSLAEARKRLGNDKILGASCYNQFELAEQAQAAGVNYVAFGACFPSSTKPDAPRAEASLFTQAKQKLLIPAVAIGGITLNNAPSLTDAGADAIAVISALWDSQDITHSARQFSNLF